ncbi:MAG: transglycosylase SLT domain-containing protein, partial [Calditrichota bacterium]
YDTTLSEDKVDDALRAVKKDIIKRLKKWHAGKVDTSKLLGWEKKAYLQIAELDDKEPYLQAAKRIRIQRGIRDNFMAGVTRSFAYLPHIRRIFKEEGLPRQLVYLPHIESSFQPSIVSHVGAAGMWQFMRGSGKGLMKINKIKDERYDPLYAARGAAKMLKYNYSQLKDWALALTSYNHGLGSMRRAKRKFGKDYIKIRNNYKRRSFGFASKNFYPEFLAMVEMVDSMDVYFPGIERDPLLVFQEIKLPKSASLPELAKMQKISFDTLKGLNPGFIDDIWKGKKTVPKGYLIRLPLSADRNGVLAYLNDGKAPTLEEGDNKVALAAAKPSAAPKAKSKISLQESSVVLLSTEALPNNRNRLAVSSNSIGSELTAASFFIPEEDEDTFPLLAAALQPENQDGRKPGVETSRQTILGDGKASPDYTDFLAVEIGGEGISPQPVTLIEEAIAAAPVLQANNKNSTLEEEGIELVAAEVIGTFAVRKPVVNSRERLQVSEQVFVSRFPEDDIWQTEAALLSANWGTAEEIYTVETGILPADRREIPELNFLAVELESVDRLQKTVVKPASAIEEVSQTPEKPDPTVAVVTAVENNQTPILASVAELAPESSLRKPGVGIRYHKNIQPSVDSFLQPVENPTVGNDLPLLAAALQKNQRVAKKPGPSLYSDEAFTGSSNFLAVDLSIYQTAGTTADLASEIQQPAVKTPIAAAYGAAADPAVSGAVGMESILKYVARTLVPRNGKILVYPNETLWNYAEWLNVSTGRLRTLNQLRGSRSMQLGQEIVLDFSNQTPEEFHRKRVAFHAEKIRQMLGKETQIRLVNHTVRSGENVWTIARKGNNFPVNLLLYFNDLNKLGKLYPGDIVKLPVTYN